MPRGRRRTVLALTTLVAASTLAGCGGDDTGLPDDGWDPDAQFAPALRPAFGARVDDDRLVLWTGTPCTGVTQVRVVFDAGTGDSGDTVWRSPSAQTVEVFDALTPPAGFTVEEPLPAGFDWHDAENVSFSLDGPDYQWGSDADVAEVVAGSPDHDADTYLFQDVGWLDAADVAERNAENFLTPCTPDPYDD